MKKTRFIFLIVLISFFSGFANADNFPSNHSKVVIVRDSKVFNDDYTINVTVLNKMLDVGISSFYGVSDPLDGWRNSFTPKDKVAIKVNALGSYFAPPYSPYKDETHPELAYAIADKLIAIGVKPKNIVVFDRQALGLNDKSFQNVLERGDYYITPHPKGIKINQEGSYGSPVTLFNGEKINFRQEMYDSTKIINAPILKAHPAMGVTFALKNFVGVFKPADEPLVHGATHYISGTPIHKNSGVPGLAALNSESVIKDKSVIIVGDALRPQYRAHYYDPEGSWAYNAIIIGSDPVAVDTVAWNIIENKRKELGIDYYIQQPLGFWYLSSDKNAMKSFHDHMRTGGVAGAYIHDCAKYGLGTDNINNIDVQIIDL